MTGIVELDTLLKSMSPRIADEEYVFCTVHGNASDYIHLEPLATFREAEGLTLILGVDVADQAQLSYGGVFKQITLTVHSSLDAVGLTAAVATKLAVHGISANVVAAYFHDHVFVPSDKAALALNVLNEFAEHHDEISL